MTDWRHRRVESALKGQNPTVLTSLPEAFAVIGDVQWLPGYCVLLTDDLTVTRLSDLPRSRRLAYLESVDRLACAVEDACLRADSEFRRVNIEILGNTDEFLHTHIWPRYEWEPERYRRLPVWLYPSSQWTDPAHQLAARHDPLRAAITDALRA
ncbi:diadenosine tetraphosphate hydrolase [Rhodococcus qingshengii]|uniref:diadenosine tetraphosphate hydrolase n=1 Tax=Rhodococcus qingshengii TaxID=334542 RepID=UPI0021B0FF24|nr:diadenosine tetraphosphate hydrolase [Rhodococcus qingshengii]MCT6735300.1 diadenosine tetraphosphate hydrolase [Rhodococcus qingshengii]